MADRMDNLKSIADAARGRLLDDDADFSGVSIDSRSLQPGQAYVAIEGDRFDGHAFVNDAASAGAAGAVVAREVEEGIPRVLVADTLQALQDYARSWRARFSYPVIGVTGSVGKTTVKEMLSAIWARQLGDEQAVLSTSGNLNNHIGVPLTLLRLRNTHRAAIIEMGANHAGEIKLLTDLATPDVGVVTCAGSAHLEGFGSLDGVAHAKGELFAGLSADATAVINADDRYASLWQSLAQGRNVLTFGTSVDAQIRAEDIAVNAQGSRFALIYGPDDIEIDLPLPGRHNVINALAAAAASLAAGVDLQAIAQGLQSMRSVNGRLAWVEGDGGLRMLDDTYNANPTSLLAAMEAALSASGEHWLVLGDMAELGDNSEQQHADCGQQAREKGFKKLFTTGRLSQSASARFGAGAQHFDCIDDLIAALKRSVSEDVVLLVKGSRSARMERVIQALQAGGQH